MIDVLNKIWAEKIIDTLIANGINYFCISPGSRSTPLTMAIAKHRNALSKVLIDERGAGYHAVGYAKGSRRPAVLVCTSGTAAANYLPSVVEANNDSVPLILLTADRPPELQNIGANQTIDQSKLFSSYIRYFKNFEPPEEMHQFEGSIEKLIAGIRQSQFGPVHFNCMFREPLYPNSKQDIESNKQYSELGEYKTINKILASEEIQRLAEIINNAKSGLIILGRGFELNDRNILLDLFEKLKFTVFPDILSGFRFEKNPYIINYYDQILLEENIFSNFYDLIIQIGYGIVSKRLLKYLKYIDTNSYIQLIETDKIQDPESVVTERIECNIENFLVSILPQLQNKTLSDKVSQYQSVNLKCDNVIASSVNTLNEIAVAKTISNLIPNDSGLFLASSMPIREMDMFGEINAKNIHVAGNRGVSGIDGVISSAIGYSNGLDKDITLIAGDLSFLHDINALLSLRNTDNQLIIILVNNNGGGIFSFLPISKDNEQFEEYFGIPHGLDFINIADQFNVRYFNPTTLNELKEFYVQAINSCKHTIIEVKTDRESNYIHHQTLFEKMKDISEL